MKKTTVLGILILLILINGCVQRGSVVSPGETIQEPQQQTDTGILPSLVETNIPADDNPSEVRRAQLESNLSQGMRITLLPLFPDNSTTEFGKTEIEITNYSPRKSMNFNYNSIYGNEARNGSYSLNFTPEESLNAVRLTPPYYWKTGLNSDPASLIWLSPFLLDELDGAGETFIELNYENEEPLWWQEKFNEFELDPLEGIKLDNVYAEARYEVLLNGKNEKLNVITAKDAFKTSYTILNNPDNPLILEVKYFSGNAKSSAEKNTLKNLKDLAGWKITEIRTQ